MVWVMGIWEKVLTPPGNARILPSTAAFGARKSRGMFQNGGRIETSQFCHHFETYHEFWGAEWALMWHCWQILASSELVTLPCYSTLSSILELVKPWSITFTTSPWPPRFLEPNSMLKLWCHQLSTLTSLSIVYFSPFVPVRHHIPVFLIPVLIALLCASDLALLISLF